MSSEKKVRMGVVGVGGMGSHHANSILNGKVDRCELTAVCDIDAKKLEKYDEHKSVAQFSNIDELLASNTVDAIVVATPHPDHPVSGAKSLRAGLHTLIEKPLTVHKQEAEELIAVYRDVGENLVFAEMFNQRTQGIFRELRRIIKSGELGEILRINWLITAWYRPQAYYNSGGWRATWAGEGGGVLMNQCPHQLDLWQWMFGMPKTVHAFAKFGKYHDIEVEDDVTAYMEYENGATGLFVTTTGESPGSNRLEVTGDLGKIVAEDGKITFQKLESSLKEFTHTSKAMFASPPRSKVTIENFINKGGHEGILSNFTAAILDGKELLGPAPDGINGVELNNAMMLSAFTNSTVTLPLDSSVYAKKLAELRANSNTEKQVDETTSTGDFSSSF